MCRLALYWSVILFSSVLLGVGTAFLTLARVNLPSHNIYGSSSESDALPNLTFWLLLLGMMAVALLTLVMISNWALNYGKNYRKRVIPFGNVALAALFMVFSIAFGLEYANWIFIDQSQAINASFNAEVSRRQQVLANAPYQCADELAANASAWALPPCASCLLPDQGYIESYESIWVISREANGNPYNTWTFLTRQEPLDTVFCESEMAEWSPYIWSSFSSLNINETEPQCLNIPLNFNLPIGQALLAYTGLFNAWVPMQTAIRAVPSSTDHCVRVQGWVSKRFWLTSICGQCGVNSNAPNPLSVAKIPADFNCTSNALAEFQASYKQHVLDLNASISDVPTPYVYDQTPLDTICGILIAITSVSMLLLLLGIVLAACKEPEHDPLLYKPNEQKIYPSIN